MNYMLLDSQLQPAGSKRGTLERYMEDQEEDLLGSQSLVDINHHRIRKLHNLHRVASGVRRGRHILGAQLGSIYGDIAFLAHTYDAQTGIGRSGYGHQDGSAAGGLWGSADSLSKPGPSAPASPALS